MKKLKETELSFRLLTLFVFLAFTLICSGSIFAQDFPDLLNYNLNGNNPPGSVFNATTTSGGQVYRGEGASYSGFWIAPSTTVTSVQQCSTALSTLSGATVTATAGTYVGGYLLCTATVPPLTTSYGDWAFAGDWTNYYSFMNLELKSEAEARAVQGGQAPGNADVQTEQCLDCHHYGANDGSTYLLTGHKNGFRKVISGDVLHSSDGSVYTGVTWTNVPPTTTAGAVAYYNIAGWMTPGGAPDWNYVAGGSAGCAYCHVTGYNPVAPNTKGSSDPAYLWTGWDNAQYANGVTSGSEPTQVIPVAGVLITGISSAAAGGGGVGVGNAQPTITFTFTGTLPSIVTTNAYVQVSGFTKSANDELLNGTSFLVSGVNGQTFTATSTIPYAYYPALSGSLETGTMVVLSPITQCAALPCANGVVMAPENAASGYSSWSVTGISCERCHIATVGTSTISSDYQYNAGHEFGSVTGAVSTPVIPTGTGATALCMECHRLQVASTKGAAAISPLYPPVVKLSTAGVYSDGDYQGSEFLNSPHAQYLGTLSQNAQGSADTSVNFTGTYSSIFEGVNGASSTTNSGCTGCHDPHQTIVGSEFTGGPLASASTAIQNANLLQPLTYTAAATTGVGTANTYNNLNFGALMGSGTVQANNCDNCHSAAGPGEAIYSPSTSTWIQHPVGPGTMFPNSSNGTINPVDVPGACMVCHMEGSSGQPKMHLFRINPSGTYYTYNAGAYSGQTSNYNATSAISGYTVTGTNVTFTTATSIAAVGDEITVSTIVPAVANNSYIVTGIGTGTFTASLVPLGLSTMAAYSSGGTATISAMPYNNYTPGDGEYTQAGGASTTNPFILGGDAIGLDVDIACGQCHGGGTAGQNPYGIAVPNPAPPAFTRTYLATAATGMHNLTIPPPALTPILAPGTGTFNPTQIVTITSATAGATICYTTDGSKPTAATAGTCDTIDPTEVSLVNGGNFTLSATTTVEAIATLASATNSVVASATYTLGATTSVTTPTFAPPAGTYPSGTQTVTITSDPGTTICYTTNGTTPVIGTTAGTCSTTTPGELSLGPNPSGAATISVSVTETVKAIATISTVTKASSTATAAYTISAVATTPTFSVAAGTYATVQTVNITSATSGATICYTTNGTAPTAAAAGTCDSNGGTESSLTNGGSISVGASETVEAIATFAAGTNSAAASASYTINLAQAAAPTFGLAPGIYYTPQTVTLSDTTAGATTCYTTNGTTPAPGTTAGTCATGTPYASFVLSAPATIAAIAGGPNFIASAVASETVTIKALAPSFSPGGGTYSGAETVKITDNASSSTATIYYAFNGAPTTASLSCASPCSVAVSASETLEAVAAYDAGLLSESSTTSATYKINAPAPTFSPAAGTYKTTQNIVLSDSLNVTICYTTNGTSPVLGATTGTCSVGTPYTAAIPLSSSATIYAIAGLNGYGSSTLVRAIYTIP